MASQTQKERFWSDTGTINVYTSEEVDDLFTEAAEIHSDTAAQSAYTRVLAIQRLLANAAKLTDYTQNQSSERQSQVFDHLQKLLTYWKGELATAVGEAAGGAARFGGVRRKPSRIKEYPGA